MIIAFIIVLWHYIADFVFQAETWAVNKSKNWKSLTYHVLTYSGLWFFSAVIMLYTLEGCNLVASLTGAAVFAMITLVAHWITDYYTSRVTSKMFATGRIGSPIPNLGAFSVIGFDQVLHYAQLFTTYYFISKLI